jgi:hypothetical protein
MRSSQAQAATRTEKMRAARQTLDQHIQALAEQMAQGKSEQLVRYPEFAARFHSYSSRLRQGFGGQVGNVLLILAQRPKATRVAGSRCLKDKGKRARKNGSEAVLCQRVVRRPAVPEAGPVVESFPKSPC